MRKRALIPTAVLTAAALTGGSSYLPFADSANTKMIQTVYAAGSDKKTDSKDDSSVLDQATIMYPQYNYDEAIKLLKKQDDFTKNKDYMGQISKKYLSPEDHVLIVDDFLANGEAVMGMIDLCHQAGATVEGIGIVVEKGIQQGRHRFEEAGYEVQSLAIVKGFEDGKVILD